MTIRDDFDKVVEELYETNCYLAAEITKIGYPELVSDRIPTAGVSWDKDKKKVKFMFNRKFYKKLSYEQFSYVVQHEAMHFVNMHIFLFRDKIDYYKSKGKKNSEINKIMRKMNIAADCVVNDSLTNLYEVKRLTDLGGVAPIYGQDMVKCDTHDMTLEEVFYLLPEEEGGEGSDGTGHSWESFFNEDGSMNEDFVDAIKDFIEDNMDNSAISDEELSKIDDMKEKMENSSDSSSSRAGKEAMGKKRAIDGLGKNSLNWNKLLFDFTQTRKIIDLWNRPNRKMTEVYPEAILPSYEPEEKEDIFIAIDTSGSIDHHACSLFVDVVRSTPKRFRVRAITFDTRCYDFDIKSKDNPRGGGGTNFQIIEDYIQNNLKKYPKAIFVLTDGCGTPIRPQYPKRWCWLLYGMNATNYIENMKHFEIKDLLK
jgi:predicted metal-dependent peptidase